VSLFLARKIMQKLKVHPDSFDVFEGYIRYLAKNLWALPERTIGSKKDNLSVSSAFKKHLLFNASPEDIIEKKEYPVNKRLYVEFLKRLRKNAGKTIQKLGPIIEGAKESALPAAIITFFVVFVPILVLLKLFLTSPVAEMLLKTRKVLIFPWEALFWGVLASASIFIPVLLIIQDLRTKLAERFYLSAYKKTLKKEVKLLRKKYKDDYERGWKYFFSKLSPYENKLREEDEDKLLSQITENIILLRLFPELRYVKKTEVCKNLIEAGVKLGYLEKKICPYL
jgi:hypothetical protein